MRGPAYLIVAEHFRSSVQLVTVGIENFFTLLSRGQWAAMGLSISMLSFSLITSTVVRALVIAHSRRPGVWRSPGTTMNAR